MKIFRLFSLSLASLFLLTSALRADPLTDSLRLAAEAYANAIKNTDVELMVKYTWPKLIEVYGGKEKMVASLLSGKQELQAKGLKVESILIGAPGPLRFEGERIYCIVPVSIAMLTPNSKILQTTYFLALSRDKGGSWTFLDGNALQVIKIKSMVPDFPDDFTLPEVNPPKIEDLPK